MKPEQVHDLNPLFAQEMMLAEFEARNQLHDAAGQLNSVTDGMGESFDPRDLSLGMQELLEAAMGISMEKGAEKFLQARLLPPHDSFYDLHGRTLFSSFLVVDSRHPLSATPDDATPNERIRGYFLISEQEASLPGTGGAADDTGNVLPYYVVSVRGVSAQGTAEEMIMHNHSTVFGLQIDAFPIREGVTAWPVHDPKPYQALTQEMSRAAEILRSNDGGGARHY